MPKKKVEGPQKVQTLTARAPELRDVAYQVAGLALAQVENEGALSVRQREQLRRALATAGDALGWTGRPSTSDDSVVGVGKDVMTMAKVGGKTMAKELAEDLARKKTEISVLLKTSEATRTLAENEKTTYPTEIAFSYTVRDASGDLVTKYENLEVNDAGEALSAADTVGKNITGRTKLTDLMIIELKQKQKQLDVMTKTLPDFLDSSQDLVRDVIANLQ